ncbi:hypothetical protein ATV_gp18 [Bicaudavirus pozzuoliense]|uniref:Uncharacterized protein ORF211 n=2 Tax=Acidianus two-tailed virus TaxID=315953 RepID=Y211_ATV|nr:hypothetical protein ATV_gp18 [Acidianus two-tailed virus]Q3V4W3.1 RecName: Full=Uncharacterized protein ORF211 [Acidianus two-tailed virus]AON96497.1 hypothetical protein [Acidianus two-tailed phage variant 1]CAI59851.1 hypothetical protein [Acidianus two-tailed virus]
MLELFRKKKVEPPKITVTLTDLMMFLPTLRKHVIPYQIKCDYCSGIVTDANGFVLYRRIPIPDAVLRALINFSNAIDQQLKDTIFYFSMAKREVIGRMVYKAKLNALKKGNTKNIQKITAELPRLLYRILYPYKATTSILYIDGAVYPDIVDFVALREEEKTYISNNFSFYLYADSSYVYAIMLTTREQILRIKTLLANRDVPLRSLDGQQ